MIFDRCENDWMRRFVSQLWDALDPYRVLSYRRMWHHDSAGEVPTEILHEHEQILKALERRDIDRSLRLLDRHRTRSETFLATLVQGA